MKLLLSALFVGALGTSAYMFSPCTGGCPFSSGSCPSMSQPSCRISASTPPCCDLPKAEFCVEGETPAAAPANDADVNAAK